MNDKIKLGTIRLEYYVRGGPIAALDFAHQLVSSLKESVNNIRVVKLEAGYDMFTGSTEVSLEIQPGEKMEQEIREVFKRFETPPVSPSWEDIEAHLWSLWIRRADGSGYTQMATGSKDYLCERAESTAKELWDEWQWWIDPRVDKGTAEGKLGDRMFPNGTTPLYLQHGTQRKEWMGVTYP